MASKSWSVTGVSPESRETARAAAKRAGLTLGAWLDRAIMQAARQQGAAASEPPSAQAPGAERPATRITRRLTELDRASQAVEDEEARKARRGMFTGLFDD